MTQINDETLRSFVGYHLKRSFNVIQSELIQTLRPFELRMLTYSALVLVVDNPGLNQSQLSQKLDIERPNLVVIIDELEERELISRERVPTDRRSYALHPTDAGRALYQDAIAAVAQNEKDLLSAIDPDQLAQLVGTLQMIENSKKRHG